MPITKAKTKARDEIIAHLDCYIDPKKSVLAYNYPKNFAYLVMGETASRRRDYVTHVREVSAFDILRLIDGAI